MTKPAPKQAKKPSARLRKPAAGKLLPVETVSLESLKPHPKNYRGHPQDQIEEIAASISSGIVTKHTESRTDGDFISYSSNLKRS